jgi:hypothetical protein
MDGDEKSVQFIAAKPSSSVQSSNDPSRPLKESTGKSKSKSRGSKGSVLQKLGILGTPDKKEKSPEHLTAPTSSLKRSASFEDLDSTSFVLETRDKREQRNSIGKEGMRALIANSPGNTELPNPPKKSSRDIIRQTGSESKDTIVRSSGTPSGLSPQNTGNSTKHPGRSSDGRDGNSSWKLPTTPSKSQSSFFNAINSQRSSCTLNTDFHAILILGDTGVGKSGGTPFFILFFQIVSNLINNNTQN